MNKKFRTFSALALTSVMAMGFFSCKSGNNAQQESDSSMIEEQQVAEEATAPVQEPGNKLLGPDFFNNPDNEKGKAPADSLSWTVTPSGLKYAILKEGTGKSPKAEDVVTVHYTGRLRNGNVFDSSVSRGEPASFPLNRVIPGWTEGLQLMKEGGLTTFYIPYNLAYGEAGTPDGSIPPKADLIFDVQLLQVNE